MKKRWRSLWTALATAAAFWMTAAFAMQVELDEQGIRRIAVSQEPEWSWWVVGSAPEIEYVTLTDVRAQRRPGDIRRQFNAVERAWVVETEWARARVRCDVAPHGLWFHVSIENLADEPITSWRMRLGAVRFPRTPEARPWKEGKAEFGTYLDQPGVASVEVAGVTVAFCRDSVNPVVRFGFQPMGRRRDQSPEEPATYALVCDSRVYDSDEDGQIEPGQSFSFRLSLRVREGYLKPSEIASDLFEEFRRQFPFQLNWPDRRPLGRAFIASGAHRSATNPRGFFWEPRLDALSEEGRAAFRERALKMAQTIVNQCRAMDAQGVIVWNIEGEEHPHPITYIGDPRELPNLAPEMDAVADEFFATIREAGFRVGVCIRPSRIRRQPQEDGRIRLVHGHWGFDRVAEMSEKIEYAKRRWGATLFYMDTNTHFYRKRASDKVEGRIIPAADIIRLAKMHPDALIIPEFVTPAYRAVVAAYHELRAHAFGGYTGTPAAALELYPDAFSWIIPNDGDYRGRRDELIRSVRRGDMLSFDAWWGSSLNTVVREIYAAARAEGPAPGATEDINGGNGGHRADPAGKSDD